MPRVDSATGAGRDAAVTSVFIVHDHEFLRSAYARVLDAEEGVTVDGVASNSFNALQVMRDNPSDVFIVRAELPGLDGSEFARQIRSRNVTAGVILLARSVDPSAAAEFMRGNPTGKAYFPEIGFERVDDLVQTIEIVARGGTCLDPRVVGALADRPVAAPKSQVARLTPRETEVLAALADGLSNAGIAGSLHLQRRTVQNHLTSITDKLALNSRDDRSSRVDAALAYLRSTGRLHD